MDNDWQSAIGGRSSVSATWTSLSVPVDLCLVNRRAREADRPDRRALVSLTSASSS